MMKRNVGGLDRGVRILVGLALLIGFFMHDDAAFQSLYLLGLIPLYTGIVAASPEYTWLGISTRRRRR